MGWLTKWGGMWGSIPQTTGNIYFVSAGDSYTVEGRTYRASDDNDGLSPERAKRTLGTAIDLAVGGDVVLALPGDHTVSTASLAMDTAGVTLMALPLYGNWLRPRTTITTDITADEIVNVTAADCQIAYIRFIPITAAAAVDFSAAATRLWVHHCSFDLVTPAANTATIGIGSVGVGAAHPLFENNYFDCDGAQGPGIALSSSTNFLVQNSVFTVRGGTWAAALSVTHAADGEIYDNRFLTSFALGLMTTGILGAAMDSTHQVAIARNLFSVNAAQVAAIDTFGSTDAYLAENYVMSAGGGAGGSIIATIT